MENHSLIYSVGTWEVAGVFFDADDHRLQVDGVCSVEHKDSWTIDFMFNICGESINTIVQKIVINNPLEQKTGLCYMAEHSLLGSLSGKIMIAEDHLVNVFEVNNKIFSGSEYFKKINDGYYKNRGIVFREEKKFYSWSFEMKRRN